PTSSLRSLSGPDNAFTPMAILPSQPPSVPEPRSWPRATFTYTAVFGAGHWQGCRETAAAGYSAWTCRRNCCRSPVSITCGKAYPKSCSTSRRRSASTTRCLSSKNYKSNFSDFQEEILARIIVVTSGKGGVGKTTSSAAISMGLALRGHKTAIIDFDVGLRNLDLIMGCERRVVYDLVNVINGEATLNQALIKDKRCENLFILPASQTRDKDALSIEGVGKILEDLAKDYEYIVCDS